MCEKQLELNLNNTITIPLSEYQELIQSKVWLSCLEAAGVDNWEGYNLAKDLLDDEEEE